MKKATLFGCLSSLCSLSYRRALCLLTKIAFNGASIQRNHLSRFKKIVAYLPRAIYTCSFIHSANDAPVSRECNIFSLVSQCSLIYESPSFHLRSLFVLICFYHVAHTPISLRPNSVSTLQSSRAVVKIVETEL